MVAAKKTQTGTNPLVLIVHEDVQCIQPICNYLSARGYRTSYATDVETALMAARKYHPDAVLANVNIPDLDGWTLLRQLRINHNLTFTAVLITSDAVNKDNRLTAFRLGADDYLEKGFQLEELCYRINKALLSARRAKRITFLETQKSSQNSTDGEQSSLTGALDKFSLTSLIPMCQMGKSTGVLVLVNEHGETGVLYFYQGELMSAKSIGKNKCRSEEAVAYMITWRKGTFELSAMETSNVPKEIQTPTESLLLQAAAFRDEDLMPVC